MDLLLFVITITIGCLAHGFLGFGGALVATPLALLYLDKEAVVCSMLVVGTCLNGLLIARIREPISGRLVLLLFLASLPGMPLGVWILKAIPLNLMKVLVGILVVVFAVVLRFGRLRVPQNKVLAGVAGFFSGVLNTSTTMSGPPVLLLLVGQHLPKNQFRKTLVTFFFLTGLVGIGVLAFNRVITLHRASFGLLSIPFVFAAGFLGDRIVARVPQKPFELLSLGVLFLAGVYSIVSGLL